MKLVKMMAIMLIGITLTQCGSKPFDANPPFTITSATYTQSLEDAPDTNSIIVNAAFTGGRKVIFKELFFLGKTTSISVQQHKFTAYFSAMTNHKKDLQLHSNMLKEYGNELPKNEKFPFELKNNEAVVSYLTRGKLKYFKIKKIQKQ